jgi:hypothetical protein
MKESRLLRATATIGVFTLLIVGKAAPALSGANDGKAMCYAAGTYTRCGSSQFDPSSSSVSCRDERASAWGGPSDIQTAARTALYQCSNQMTQMVSLGSTFPGSRASIQVPCAVLQCTPAR